MGADEAIAEAPIDRLAAAASVVPPSPPPRAAPPVIVTEAPAGTLSARQLAAAAKDLGELAAAVHAFDGCALKRTATNTVVADGRPGARLMVIGEAPGAEEDRRGEPFVGRAGHLLDAMLHAIGLNRGTNVYIANVLKSRPPGNRDPKPEEVAACLPYLMRQIALLQPRLMLAVGRIAAQNLLSTDMPLGRLRGKVHHFGELNTPLIVTYHPAYLLRTPADKRKAWEDLKFARNVFRQLTDRVGTDGNLC